MPFTFPFIDGLKKLTVVEFFQFFWSVFSLAADVTMRALVEAALHPFSVTNRPNVFVYREQNGNVFYLKLSVTAIKKRRHSSPNVKTPKSSQVSRASTPTQDYSEDTSSDAFGLQGSPGSTPSSTRPSTPRIGDVPSSSDDESDEEIDSTDLANYNMQDIGKAAVGEVFTVSFWLRRRRSARGLACVWRRSAKRRNYHSNESAISHASFLLLRRRSSLCRICWKTSWQTLRCACCLVCWCAIPTCNCHPP